MGSRDKIRSKCKCANASMYKNPIRELITRNKTRKIVLSLKKLSRKTMFSLQRRIFSPRALALIMNENPAFSAPLLPPHADESVVKEEEEEEDTESHETVFDQSDQQRSSFSGVVEEVKQLVFIALPMIFTSLLIYGKMAISMHFLGKIGKETLAGGVLAIGVANITGYSVISGLSTGMEGISAQAYGANQWRLMSLTLQRTIIILVLACTPIALFWFNFDPFLLMWGQNPTISSIATTYLAFSIPDLFIQALINPLKIFLRAQRVTSPLMLSAAFSLFLHVPINYLIVHNSTLGIRGIALACATTDLNFLLTLLLYLKLSGVCSKSWTGWSFECLKQWNPILRQAIPSCISVCLEWWWYEILIVLSGLLNDAAEAVASSGIIIQATALIYNFPYSLSMAVSTRVGNELGAKRPNKAKTSSSVALCCAIFTGLMAMAFTVSMRDCWGRMFTDDQAILSLLASTLPVVGLCEIGNCPQTTICGVLRGSARPKLGANLNLFSFYVVGLPVSVFMGFHLDLGFLGLWVGLLAAQVVCAVAMVTALATTDWEAQAERSEELIGRENVTGEENNNEVMDGLISA